MIEEEKAIIKEKMRRIAVGEGHHGSFLTAFAEAFIRADMENEALLMPTARILVEKYNL